MPLLRQLGRVVTFCGVLAGRFFLGLDLVCDNSTMTFRWRHRLLLELALFSVLRAGEPEQRRVTISVECADILGLWLRRL